MNRRQPTEEQRQAAAERRARMRELAATLRAMPEDERAALAARCAHILTIEGRPLSPFNACMIATQLPAATLVGGFQQWRRNGRQVSKGARGLAIWAPAGPRRDASDAPDLAPAPGELEGDSDRPRFLLVTVFDVSQTEAYRPNGAELDSHRDAAHL